MSVHCKRFEGRYYSRVSKSSAGGRRELKDVLAGGGEQRAKVPLSGNKRQGEAKKKKTGNKISEALRHLLEVQRGVWESTSVPKPFPPRPQESSQEKRKHGEQQRARLSLERTTGEETSLRHLARHQRERRTEKMGLSSGKDAEP